MTDIAKKERNTSKILEECKSRIDFNVEYELKDLKKIITNAFRYVNSHEKISDSIRNNDKKTNDIIDTTINAIYSNTAKCDDDVKDGNEDEEDDTYDFDDDAPKKRGRPRKEIKLDKNGKVKPKRKLSAYNKYTSIRIPIIRQEHGGLLPAQECMSIAAKEWREMTKEKKNSYNIVENNTK